jgi:hypothetical protein
LIFADPDKAMPLDVFHTFNESLISYNHIVLVSPMLSSIDALFVWLISHQPAVLFSQNKSATSNQPAVLFSQNKSAPAISHQPNEQAGSQALELEPNLLLLIITGAPTYPNHFKSHTLTKQVFPLH